MKFKLIAFLMLTGFSLLLGVVLRNYIQQKSSAQVAMSTSVVEIPLEEYGNHLYVQGQINGAATDDLLLDSGAGDMFIGESQAQTLRLKAITKAHIPGPKRNIDTVDVPGLTVQLGGVTIRDQKSVMIPTTTMTGLKQYLGRSLSGIVGYELFQQLVVEIDYQYHILRLHRPENYRYSGKTKPIPLKVQGSRSFVEAMIFPYGYEPLQGLFMIDTGSGGALSINAGCELDQKLITAAPRILLRKLTTIHGASDTHFGRVQKMQIGQQVLERPLAIFAKDAKGECDRVTGKIGHQILRQFKVILDYPQQQIILEPNTQNSADPYEYDLSGLWIQATGTDLKTYKVGAVFPDTPAAKAGFQTGDIIKKIEGKPSTELTLAQVKQLLSQSGRRIKLEVARDSKSIQADLSLQPLL